MFQEVDSLVKRLWQFISSSASCLVGAAANIIVVALTLPFATVSPGGSIRPMGWATLMGLIAVGTFVIGMITVALDFCTGQREQGLAGLLLCLMPFPVAVLLLNLLSFVVGFRLAE